MKKFFKFLITFLILVLVLGIILKVFLEITGSAGINKNSKEIDLELLSETVKNDRENILLLGVDNLDSKNKGESMRTDTMILLSVDPKTKTGFILSIPRDTRVAMEGTHNKINAAHSHGGVNLTLKVVKENFPFPIHHYVKVDYKALFETVDIMGGVDVNVPMDMHYEDPYATPPLKIDLKKGLQTLNGQKAMQFLRFRKGYANQDLGRIEAQQDFIKAVFKKLLNAESIPKIPEYIEVFHDNVETDMSLMDMFTVAAKTIKIKPHNIKRAVIPGKADMISGISYFIKDDEKTKTLMAELSSGNYYKEEPPIEEQKKEETIKNTENKKHSIVVLNGSGISGRAQRAYDLLKINNLEPIHFGNGNEFDHNQTIIYTKDVKLGENIKQILESGIVNIEQKQYNNKTVDALIILGKDFNK